MNNFGNPLHYFGYRDTTISLLYSHFLLGKRFKTVYEPFCGSASFVTSMMQRQLAKHYVISDAYRPITDSLKSIVTSHANIMDRYAKHVKSIDGLVGYEAKQSYYNRIKQEFNASDELEENIDFMFLNNFTKFYLPIIENGIYKGEFSTINKFQDRTVFVAQQATSFLKICKANSIEIKHSDFDKVLSHTLEQDFVFMDPPYPDLVGQISIYHRPEKADVLHQKLIEQIVKLNQSNTAFILLYGTHSVSESYLMDCENLGLNHYLILSQDPTGLYSEYFEHCYVSKKILAKNQVESNPYILNYEEVRDKSYADLINLTKVKQNRLQDQPEKEQSITLKISGKGISVTSREKEVIECLKLGYTAKQTANLLNISHRTVEVHLDNLKKKSNLTSKLALIAQVREA